ncbi:TIGR04222 domain-containing membrane protein [Archangium gephyra]|uniref:TIGR04222 domain-containing membrane protein n=1 Tax=Archangium gephyra TaxID=48 RepID=UPI003B804457
MNPLDWTGPQFLIAYAVFLVAVCLAGLLWQYLLNQPSRTPEPHELDLGAYEVAVLDDADTAVKAAVLALVHGKSLNYEAGTLSVATALPAKAAPLERVIHAAVSVGEGEFHQLREAARRELKQLEESLRRRGFLLTPEQSARVHHLPRVLFGVALGLGVLKLFVGLDRDKPVLFLVMELIVGTVLGMVVLGSTRRRTPRGTKALELLRARHEPLRTTASTGGTGQTLSAGNLVLAAGLFGLGTLSLMDVHPLRSYLMPENGLGSGGGGGGSSSSSCSGGGSSCSGGCGGCGGGGD